MKRLIPIFALFLLAACPAPKVAEKIIDGDRVLDIDACGHMHNPLYEYPCVPTPTVPPPKASPPPMLTPAVDFADGVSEVPDGSSLLLEYSSTLNTTVGRGCGTENVFGSSFYGYSFDGKRGQGETQKTANRSRVLIGQIDERTNGNLSTIFAYVTPVDTLPEATYGGPRLRAVDKQGAAIVDIDGQPFYIYPGSH